MNIQKRNKIKGAVYGFAIGDAMGATTEFMSSYEISKKYGKFGCLNKIIGGGWLNLKPGEVTDDTEMTMCVMDALMFSTYEDLFKLECIKNFCNWLKSGPKDIGGQCAKSINSLILEKDIPVDETALGNGSLMRAMPCALIYRNDLNIIQGKLTHNNDVCSGVIQNYSRLIQGYLDNKNITNTVKGLLKPSGYIINTFNNAVFWSQKNSFYDAIIGPVNDGGDADTIAAITGSLAGAKFGFSNIPNEWVNQLNNDVKIFLEKFINFTFTYLQI